MRVPERLERPEPRMEPEETVEIDRSLRIGRTWNRDARARRVVLALAERYHHVEAVDRAALEDRDEDLAPHRGRGLDGARQERRREAQAEEGQPSVLHEDASREHGYLLWNSGDPSVNAAICFGSVAFAIVAAVDDEMSLASADPTWPLPGSTPRMRPLTSASAKFILFSSAPVFTHASALSA